MTTVTLFNSQSSRPEERVEETADRIHRSCITASVGVGCNMRTRWLCRRPATFGGAWFAFDIDTLFVAQLALLRGPDRTFNSVDIVLYDDKNDDEVSGPPDVKYQEL